ncbi:acyltransferase [Mucilaginibacter sp. CAU 1740]|uniref:acyltransferase family protein n=1 Tax=Mucilaginibacter sp. CAU 1740 TaxID=3140365 RepID=UPI00325ADFF8
MASQVQQLVSNKPLQFNSIQVFRFIAALMVIICHSSFYTSERLAKGSYIYGQGANGVELFFVISGFVMIISSQNLINLKNGWKTFAVKRVIRIVPIYWIITTIKLLLLLKTSGVVLHSQLNFWLAIKSYFFIPALNIDGEYRPLYGVGWTLNMEMFFYLLFTIALAFKWRPITFLALFFIPLAVLSYYKQPGWPAVAFYADPIVLDFLYGMIAAKLILQGYKIPGGIAIACIIGGLLYMFVPVDVLPVKYPVNEFTTGLAAFVIIYSGASIDGGERELWRWPVYLGTASYSLYLIHPTVAPLIPTVLSKFNYKMPLLSVALSVLSANVAGALFFRFCEVPVTEFFKRLLKKKTRPAIVATDQTG